MDKGQNGNVSKRKTSFDEDKNLEHDLGSI